MSNSELDLDSNYVDNWGTEATQCKYCTSFLSKNGIHVCADYSDKSFEEVLAADGVISPEGHCDYFQSKD
jgi:hypothetical protein